MAGLWCVTVGYGRKELAEVAYEQMLELPYYNSFFKCTTPTPVLLAQKLAEIAPKSINQVFFGSSGSESNDTALRLVRHYWALEGKPEKNRIISRKRRLSRLDGRRRLARRHEAHARPARRSGAQHRARHAALCLRERRARRERRGLRPARGEGRRGRDPRGRPRQCRGLHRRADHGGRRRQDPAEELLDGDRAHLPQVRRAADARRGHHRLRPHRQLVRRADLRHRARHDHHRQGADLGLPAAVGAAGRRPRRRDAGRKGRRVLPRLHLFRPSGRLRGRAEEHRDHRAGRAGRARPQPTPAPISSSSSGSASPAIRWSARRVRSV